MTTRRMMLKAAAASAALSGFPAIIGASRAAEPISVVTPLGFLIDFLDTMNAYSGGHFAREGLDAKVIGANSGAQTMQLIVSGQANFARDSPADLIRALVARQPVPTAIASIVQGCPFRVFSLAEKPVREPKDFKGKTIGLITLASPTGIYLDVMLAKAGLKPGDVERQATGGSPGAFEIMKQGRVDCFISSTAVEVALKRAKAPVEIWNPRNYLPLPGQVYCAMPETLAARPDVTVRFLKAHKSSVDEMAAGPLGPIILRAAKDFEIPGVGDLDMSVAMVEAAMAAWSVTPTHQDIMRNIPDAWRDGCDALRLAGIADIADPASLYTNQFVEKALNA